MPPEVELETRHIWRRSSRVGCGELIQDYCLTIAGTKSVTDDADKDTGKDCTGSRHNTCEACNNFYGPDLCSCWSSEQFLRIHNYSWLSPQQSQAPLSCKDQGTYGN